MKTIYRRYLYFIVALFFNSLGVAFITKALLGTSPISSVPYVLSIFTNFSMGQWTVVFNLLIIAADFILMKRDDIKKHLFDILIQLPVTVFFGMFIDLSMYMLDFVTPSSYIDHIFTLIVGCIVLALGVSMEVQADVAMLPGEFLVRVISKVTNREFGNVKLVFDSSLVLLAVIISFSLSSAICGVREGTVIAAILVGPITRLIRPRLGFAQAWLFLEKENKEKANSNDDKDYPFVITITREFGSGGRILANNIAKTMNINYYDKEFIELVTQESRLDHKYVSENEQQVSTKDLMNLILQGYESDVQNSLSSRDVLFVAQSKVVRRLAHQESCVILGRLADYVLADWPKHRILRVFCYCDPATAYDRCSNVYHDPWTPEDIKKQNDARIAHYEHYTGRKWGDVHNYDLMVNTASMTIDMATRLITALAVGKSSDFE